MLVYPGGTSLDVERTGYSFSENFFSDLGMVKTYSGKPKTGSLWLFGSALALMGVVLILFFVCMRNFFKGSKQETYMFRVGAVSGTVAGISCMGIAFTPWDLYLSAHLIFSYSLSWSFLFAIIFYSLAILKNDNFPNFYAAVFGFYIVLLLLFIGLLLWGPGTETREGLIVLAVGQKIIIYTGMICMCIQFLGALLYATRHAAKPRRYIND